LGSVAAHHAGDQRLWDIGAAQPGERIPGACGVVVRISRAPYDLVREILRQFLDHPLLGVEPQHDVAVLPHLFGLG
jgi:hypothetical protein